MQDQPDASALVAAVAKFLRDRVLPELGGQTGYLTRVAANILDIAVREINLGRQTEVAEQDRLRELLGEDGDLAELNAHLALAIAEGTLSVETPGLVQHLHESTMAKLAVDQPRYAAYRRALSAGN